MSLPPGFLDELRNRISISQVVGRKVTWDMRKSNQGKGDMWAPCPFHQEKTASFHVDDQKGYYYCFGCQAKGDALGFIKETENVSFMEAVEILAREAGMPMPARDPQAQVKMDRRTQLAVVVEMALQFFRLQLNTSHGIAARAYLQSRALSQATLDQFEIGFAPDAWQGLWDHLAGKGVAEDLILGAGLAKPSNSGKRPYDTFRNRIMFPIRDARGRAIGFGGRAMDPNDNAKYLNSPETDLFDKGRTLYNLAPARAAAGKGQQLIVAEGYMDVIALSQAGFHAAVAPLGTAVTESQLAMMWRVTDEPVLALDGDQAGIRAANRVVDLALPLLQAGKSLRFATMPAGQDPDDVIRSGGAAAVQVILDQARPMVQVLWSRAIEGKVFDSPERKAALDKVLRASIAQIQDPSIRQHYGQDIKALRWELFRPASARPGNWTPGKWSGAAKKTAATVTAKSSALANQDANTMFMREVCIFAILLKFPDLLSEFVSELDRMVCSALQHEQLRGFLVSYSGQVDELWTATEVGFGASVLDGIFQSPHVKVLPALRRTANLDFARTCLAAEFNAIRATVGHVGEMADSLEEISTNPDEGLTWRLKQSAQSVEEAGRGSNEDTSEYQTAQNGSKLKLEERNALDDLVGTIDFSRSGRKT